MTFTTQEMLRVRARNDAVCAKRFLDPAERRARVLQAGKYRLGCENLNQIAAHIGIPWCTLNKALSRRDASIRTIMRIAAALEVSMNFLLEKKGRVND